MIEETKEILDDLKKTADTSFFAICYSQEEMDKLPKGVSNFLSLNDKQSKLLLDYITKLQQEIEVLEQKLKDNIRFDEGRFRELFDYKSRNKRAIKRISIVRMDKDTSIDTHNALDYVLQAILESDSDE